MGIIFIQVAILFAFPKLVGEDCRTGAALALISTALAMATIPFMLTTFGI